MCEVVQGQQQEQQKPEELACSDNIYTHITGSIADTIQTLLLTHYRHQCLDLRMHGKQAELAVEQEGTRNMVQHHQQLLTRVKLALTCQAVVADTHFQNFSSNACQRNAAAYKQNL